MAEKRVSPMIPPRFADEMREAVAAGEYASLDAALTDALGQWSRRHDDRADEKTWLKASINSSIDDPRPSLSMDEVKAHMDAVFAISKARRDEAA